MAGPCLIGLSVSIAVSGDDLIFEPVRTFLDATYNDLYWLAIRSCSGPRSGTMDYCTHLSLRSVRAFPFPLTVDLYYNWRIASVRGFVLALFKQQI